MSAENTTLSKVGDGLSVVSQYLSIQDLVAFSHTCKATRNASKSTRGNCGVESDVFKYMMEDSGVFLGYYENFPVEGPSVKVAIGLCVDTTENTNANDKQFAFISLVNPVIAVVPNKRITQLDVPASFLAVVIMYINARINLPERDIGLVDFQPTNPRWDEAVKGYLQSVVEKIVEMKPSKLSLPESGGKAKKKMDHVKTTQSFKCKDGVERVLYKKGDSMYVKKKSAKTGKMTFSKVQM